MEALTLTDEQAEVAQKISDHIDRQSSTPFVLFGLAGTGKTTVLADIAKRYPDAILCTLTGKAASVLRRKGHIRATTIHRAFYWLDEIGRDARGRRDLKFKTIHQADELAKKIVLIDECSMIDHALANDIIRTGAIVVAVGDPGQLPPVRGERYFNKPDFTLQTIHRQALESPIIRQAHNVRTTGVYLADGDAFRFMAQSDTADEDVLNADVILCFTNRVRASANIYARRVRSFWQSAPQGGEPLVCLKNAPDYGVFNGGVYILEAPFKEGDTEIYLNVDGDIVLIPNIKFEGIRSSLQSEDITTSFDFGYAMTVHKAQGSEWPHVLLIDDYNRMEFRKEWLYTGITRAAERILIVR